MFSVFTYTLTAEAKLSEVYWEIWTGEEAGEACPDDASGTHFVDCDVSDYFDDVTCDSLLRAVTFDSCLSFAGTGGLISCPQLGTSVYVSGLPPKAIHSRKLRCSETTAGEPSGEAGLFIPYGPSGDDPLFWNSNPSSSQPPVGAEDNSDSDFEDATEFQDNEPMEKAPRAVGGLGTAAAEPLGAAVEPLGVEKHDNRLLLDIGIPVVVALGICLISIVMIAICRVEKKCFHGSPTDESSENSPKKGQKATSLWRMAPLSDSENPGPIDYDDELVHTAIRSETESLEIGFVAKSHKIPMAVEMTAPAPVRKTSMGRQKSLESVGLNELAADTENAENVFLRKPTTEAAGETNDLF